ncbi:MAG: RNase adapter RapZ, partial [Ilumatobacteraceae bacterium]
RSEGHRVRIVYLDASTRELVKRYEASRRRHPLAAEADGLVESIELERTLLEPMKGDCDLVIDTTELNTNQLKTKLLGLFEDPVRERLQITVESFGFKHGLPLDADMVLDVRFLPNPHWDESLRPMSGLDRPVRDFVLGEPDAENFVVKLVELLAMIVPLYANEGKSYLTIAVGCTGGRHRSVAIATEIAERMRASGQPVRVGHRDIGR